MKINEILSHERYGKKNKKIRTEKHFKAKTKQSIIAILKYYIIHS